MPGALDQAYINDKKYRYRISFGPRPDALIPVWSQPSWTGEADRQVAGLRFGYPHRERDFTENGPEPVALWIGIETESIDATPGTLLVMRLQVVVGVAALLGLLALLTARTHAQRMRLEVHEFTMRQVQAMCDKSVTAKILFDARGQHVAHNASAATLFEAGGHPVAALSLDALEPFLGESLSATWRATLADGEDRPFSTHDKGQLRQSLDLHCTLSRLTLGGAEHVLLQAEDRTEIHFGQHAVDHR